MSRPSCKHWIASKFAGNLRFRGLVSDKGLLSVIDNDKLLVQINR